MTKMCDGCKSLSEIVGEDPDERDPWCRKYDNYPPKEPRFCPMVLPEFNRMNLDLNCAFCDELIIDSVKDDNDMVKIELLCEIHTCHYYPAFEEYEEKIAQGEA